MQRLVFILLLAAPFVPRAAWGMHLSGHEALPSATAPHSHHAEAHAGPAPHGHDHADAAKDSGEPDQVPDGAVHDHAASQLVGPAALIPATSQPVLLRAIGPPGEAVPIAGAPQERPESLLRPPRKA